MTPRERRLMQELRDLLAKGELETFAPATIKIKGEGGEFTFWDVIPVKVKLKR